MPSRSAQFLTGDNIGQIVPQQYGAINQVIMSALTNKKAYEDAFRKHSWEMDKASKEAIRKEREQYNAHRYKMDEIKAKQPDSSGKGNELEYQVLTQAVKMAQEKSIDLRDPEGQQMFQNIYRALLSQASGGQKGSMMMASGDTGKIPNVPDSVGAWDPRRILPGYADYGISKGSGNSALDQDTAAKLLQKAGGDKNKARAIARKLGYKF